MKIINIVLDKNESLFKNCSQRYYSLFIDKLLKSQINNRLKLTEKHSQVHYTNFL